MSTIRSINAVTLAVSDMERSIAFYRSIGFRLEHHGESFATFRLGEQALNLTAETEPAGGFWGRVIFYVEDVDQMHRLVLDAGHGTETEPADAPWKERYFHLNDPDGHQLSFARPLVS